MEAVKEEEVIATSNKKASKKPKCTHENCTNIAQKGGTCTRHGAKSTCSHEGCTNLSYKGGVCCKHGGKPIKICTHEGCTNRGWHKGLCERHKPTKRIKKKCSAEGCNNIAMKGGVCYRHGAKDVCSEEGCNYLAVDGGVCVRHGATPKGVKQCSYEGCTSQVRKGGMCMRHGAKRTPKICNQEGCTKNLTGKYAVEGGGLCARHTRERCSADYIASAFLAVSDGGNSGGGNIANGSPDVPALPPGLGLGLGAPPGLGLEDDADESALKSRYEAMFDGSGEIPEQGPKSDEQDGVLHASTDDAAPTKAMQEGFMQFLQQHNNNLQFAPPQHPSPPPASAADFLISMDPKSTDAPIGTPTNTNNNKKKRARCSKRHGAKDYDPPSRNTSKKTDGLLVQPPTKQAQQAARKTAKEKARRDKELLEAASARKASVLVQQALAHPHVAKKLLLSMALTRAPGSKWKPPSSYPVRGTKLANRFVWLAYPPLEALLRKHARQYYANKPRSLEQQVFNNELVHLMKEEAEKYGWEFDDQVFDDIKIKVRIQNWYNMQITQAKRKMKAILKDPEKKTNIKSLEAHLHLIEDFVFERSV